MTDAAFLDAVRQAVREGVAEALAALRPQATDAAADFCAAHCDIYGGGRQFYTADLIEYATDQPVVRRDLVAAMKRLCKTDIVPSALQLSLYLRPLIDAPPAGFTVEAVDVRGTLRWTVRQSRERPPPPPRDAPAR